MIKEFVGAQFQKDADLLKEIITNLLDVDITERKRKREVVDARGIYSKILHDKGYSFPMIGRSIGKDHSTIVHHFQKTNSFILIDDDVNAKYIMCRDEFFERSSVNTVDNRFEMYKNEIMHLKKRLQYIEFKEKELAEVDLKYKRLNNIINFIDANTGEGDEDRVKCKIIAVFKS